MARRVWHQIEQARTPEWSDVRHLLLVAEVLSPSTARGDRLVKRALYQEHGVPLYWIIDTDAQAVEVWTPDAREAHIEREVLAWHPSDAAEPFVLPLAKLFSAV